MTNEERKAMKEKIIDYLSGEDVDIFDVDITNDIHDFANENGITQKKLTGSRIIRICLFDSKFAKSK
jgi:septin family protein